MFWCVTSIFPEVCQKSLTISSLLIMLEGAPAEQWLEADEMAYRGVTLTGARELELAVQA